MAPISYSIATTPKSTYTGMLQNYLDQGQYTPEQLQKAGWGNYLFEGLNYKGQTLGNQSYVGNPINNANYSGAAGAATGGTAAGGGMASQGGAAGSYMGGSATPTQQPGMGPMIGGALPFSGGGSSYQEAYNNALAMNSKNYSNIMAGYNQTMANQGGVQQGLNAGYKNLAGDVQNTIQGVDASQRQAITDQYAAARGQSTQDLTNRGLGNTTVASSVNRGLGFDEAKSNIALSNQMAQLQAGYKSQLGLAGLNYGNQANMQNTNLAGRQLDFMNSVSARYPNAGEWNAMSQQAGAASRGGAGTTTNRNIDLTGRYGTGGGLVGSSTGQNSPGMQPNLSSGSGFSSPLGSGSGGGGGYGGGSRPAWGQNSSGGLDMTNMNISGVSNDNFSYGGDYGGNVSGGITASGGSLAGGTSGWGYPSQSSGFSAGTDYPDVSGGIGGGSYYGSTQQTIDQLVAGQMPTGMNYGNLNIGGGIDSGYQFGMGGSDPGVYNYLGYSPEEWGGMGGTASDWEEWA